MERPPEAPFIERSNQRALPADYAGDVVVWDIDKTYLDTHFSSLRGLLAIPLELAIDKDAIPGAVPLLRALRRGAGTRHGVVPLYFVSGSPPQLRGVIERKMTLDGVDFDGITFKDQWGLVRARRPRSIKEQVGYKLSALLLYRREMPGPSRWTLFGDDVEADADVFTLFGEVCAGLRESGLTKRLERSGVHVDDIATVHAILDGVPITENPVERVFVHLYRGTDPARFTTPRVAPVRSFLQAALVLADEEKIQRPALFSVLNDLRRLGRLSDAQIRSHLEDAETRFGVRDEDVARALEGGA